MRLNLDGPHLTSCPRSKHDNLRKIDEKPEPIPERTEVTFGPDNLWQHLQ